jgi:hypothetical protein
VENASATIGTVKPAMDMLLASRPMRHPNGPAYAIAEKIITGSADTQKILLAHEEDVAQWQ